MWYMVDVLHHMVSPYSKFTFLRIVRNHIKRGVSPRILYCVVENGYGLGGSLGDCRPALPKGRKYQMVKTQTVPR